MTFNLKNKESRFITKLKNKQQEACIRRSLHNDLDNNILNIVFNGGKKKIPYGPFNKWHQRTKFEVITNLYKRYLYPGCQLIDIACGDGDGLVLAEYCQPECELWGVDIDQKSLNIAKSRMPGAKLYKGDMLNLEFFPEGSFDVLHEFGATFFIRDWKLLINQYLRLVKDGGIILWELPQKWSAAHLMYMLSVAPKITEEDTRIQRIFRSFSPSKYMYLSNYQIEKCLQTSGYAFEVVDIVPIWYFYCRGLLRMLLDYSHRVFGDRQFEFMDRLNGFIWPRYSGFYLVIRKKHKIQTTEKMHPLRSL